jgi:chromosomal replication initiation ATPase DnaA
VRPTTQDSRDGRAGEVGGRDHSTVIHTVEVVEEMIKNDQGTAKDVENITASIKQ